MTDDYIKKELCRINSFSMTTEDLSSLSKKDEYTFKLELEFRELLKDYTISFYVYKNPSFKKMYSKWWWAKEEAQALKIFKDRKDLIEAALDLSFRENKNNENIR